MNFVSLLWLSMDSLECLKIFGLFQLRKSCWTCVVSRFESVDFRNRYSRILSHRFHNSISCNSQRFYLICLWNMRLSCFYLNWNCCSSYHWGILIFRMHYYWTRLNMMICWEFTDWIGRFPHWRYRYLGRRCYYPFWNVNWRIDLDR